MMEFFSYQGFWKSQPRLDLCFYKNTITYLPGLLRLYLYLSDTNSDDLKKNFGNSCY